MIKRYELVEAEVDRKFDRLFHEGVNDGRLLRWGGNRGNGTRNLRLDFAFHDENGHTEDMDPDSPVVLEKLKAAMKDDLCDLIQNGNLDDIADPLLNTLDGEIKRGTNLKGFEIQALTYLREYHQRRDEWEYTVYLTILPEW